jgi:hypothetical protein
MKPANRFRSFVTVTATGAVLALVLAAGCGRQDKVTAPGSSSGVLGSAASGLVPATALRPDIAAVIDVQNRATISLLRNPGVIGTGTSLDEQGRPIILVYTDRHDVSGVEASLEGVATRVQFVGKVIPYAKPGGGGTLEMGTSTGNDLECAAGTLGCVVVKGGVEYFLSNNHVFARENAAPVGERIDAPGRYDGHPICAQTAQAANLSDFRAISFSSNNTVDCAIARPIGSRAYTKQEAGGYQPSTTTVSPSIGLACKKTGRTSKLTTGSVQAINVTIRVQYTDGIATFVNQVQYPGNFIRSGDSGSLAVTESGNNPVALMFAGGSGGSFGNPIGPVLSALGISIAP